jgi:hypothetical protein
VEAVTGGHTTDRAADPATEAAEAWTPVARRGDRLAGLEPIYDGVTDGFEQYKDLARGIALRHDWGPQYTSAPLPGRDRMAGDRRQPRIAGEPPCKGAPNASVEPQETVPVGSAQRPRRVRQAVIEFTRRHKRRVAYPRSLHTAGGFHGRDGEQGSVMVSVRKVSTEPSPV